MTLKYFTDAELAAKDTGIVKLADEFGERLDALREAWGKPLIVNSCCRTAKHNAEIGGHPKSLHVYDKPFHRTGGTCACDFRRMEDEDDFKKLAFSMGFSIGNESSCVHVDDRTRVLGLPQAQFSYEATANLIRRLS